MVVLKKNETRNDLKAVRDWHVWLHHENQRGERAHLRRCNNLQQIMMQRSFFRLCRALPDLETYHLEGLALVAGLLAWVEQSTNADLPALLGKTKPGGNTPRFSELRFQRLLAAETSEDFLQTFRRAIVQAGKAMDPVLLADAILHWEAQQRHPDWYTGTRQWQYRFAKPYYTQD